MRIIQLQVLFALCIPPGYSGCRYCDAPSQIIISNQGQKHNSFKFSAALCRHISGIILAIQILAIHRYRSPSFYYRFISAYSDSIRSRFLPSFNSPIHPAESLNGGYSGTSFVSLRVASSHTDRVSRGRGHKQWATRWSWQIELPLFSLLTHNLEKYPGSGL